MADFIDDNAVPVFLINGFLDAGKSSFMAYTVSEDYFHIDGTTLLIVCEQGEVEYKSTLLKREKLIKIEVEEKETLTKSFFEVLDASYRPERVLIEYNGMWPDPGDVLHFPQNWALYQQLTIMNGQTLGIYLLNMKALMGPMLKNSELCIVNRCDGIDHKTLLDYKRKLRPMLFKGSVVVFEDNMGEIELETLDEELPYDVSKDPIVIPNDDYGVWFIDAKDYPTRYKGKTVQFNAQVVKSKALRKDEFVPCRMVMTCCEADMQPLGYIARFKDADKLHTGDWVNVRAMVSQANRSEYHGEGPYLDIINLKRTEPIEKPCGF